jgi:16S rRNA (cytosine967-C5)-methyltransferase
LRLIREGYALDEAIGRSRRFAALEGADRAFARALVMAVLRYRGTLDAVVEKYLREPLAPRQHDLRDLLRLAAAQLLVLETPPHAATSTSVDLAKLRPSSAGYAGLINAICRRLVENGAQAFAAQHPRLDMPGWLWRRLERVYGPKTAREILAAHRSPPPLDLTLRPGQDRDEWAGRLEATEIGPQSLRRTDGGRIEDLAGYEDGAWWVQDVAATLPVRLAGDVAGKSVIDLCAAPGGKTLQLGTAAAEVTAVDISGHRMSRLIENLKRAGIFAKAIKADILEWTPEAPADIVVLDAPCTATGTIRRNPDLSWSKTEKDVEALSKLQDRMIDRAIGFVKPGGLLIFATCSLLPEEGEERIAAALSRHANLTRLPCTAEEVGGLPVIDRQGDIRCLPSMLAERGGMDGFYASRLRVG